MGYRGNNERHSHFSQDDQHFSQQPQAGWNEPAGRERGAQNRDYGAYGMRDSDSNAFDQGYGGRPQTGDRYRGESDYPAAYRASSRQGGHPDRSAAEGPRNAFARTLDDRYGAGDSGSGYGGYDGGAEAGQGFRADRFPQPGPEAYGYTGHGYGSARHGSASGQQGQHGQQGQGDHSRHFDPDYHHWRENKLKEFDTEYDDWRRERYQKFSDDFDQWRQGRAASRSGGSSGDQKDSKDTKAGERTTQASKPGTSTTATLGGSSGTSR